MTSISQEDTITACCPTELVSAVTVASLTDLQADNVMTR